VLVGTSDAWSELPAYVKTAGRVPLIERSGKLLTPAENVGTSAQVSALYLSWVVSISGMFFGISKHFFGIPLYSTVFAVLKFKIKIYKRSSMKLKHRLFRKYGIFSCSSSFQ
jgi:hypothetical protein